MNTVSKGMVALLKSAILQKPQILPEGFEIEQAAKLIRSHHIVSLAYEGAVICGISVQHPVMQSFFRSYCKALQLSECQLKALKRLYLEFEAEGIDYLPLKGSRMKALYPKPELRTMGDADVLIRMEQYEKIRPLMLSLGFEEKSETDHELVWESRDLYLELHKRVIPSYNQDFYEYFGDGWKLAKQCFGTQYSMTSEDEWIYLFTHFSKHYRDGGIGIRHVVDLWVYRRENPDLDESYVEKELQKLQLLEFHENILRLLAVWFDGEPSDTKTDFISEYIFASGSWGQIENKVLSRAVRDSRHSILGFNGKLLFLWQTAFPSVEVLRDKYVILKKHPYLLPVVWLIRPFYKVFAEWDSVKQHKRKLDAISGEAMEERKRLLRYVGLEFHF